jgi:AP-3 complex subunit delta-1
MLALPQVVKLLGSLVPEEPRLARKLLEPLATIIQNTAAKSLLYECIHTVTLALPFARKADGTDSRNVQVRHPSPCNPSIAALSGPLTIVHCIGVRQAVVNLCSEHLRQFVEDSDQNLKYLGLVGFVNLMKSHPKAVVDHKELVLACLSDDDVTIRMKVSGHY